MKRIILILLTFIGTSYANFNLEWEVDVETFINSGYPTGYWEVDDYGMMEDEKVILYIQPTYEITIEPMDETGYACVLDKDGNLLYLDFFNRPVGASFFGAQSKAFFISGGPINQNAGGYDELGNYITDEEYIYGYFLNSSNSYDKIIMDDYNFPNQYDEDPSDSSDFYASLNEYLPIHHPNCFYRSTTTNFSIFKKYTYQYDDTPIVISSQTSSGFSQDNFVLNWESSSGTEYQIQSSTDLINWVNVGNAIVGTGETMTWANHVTNSQAFYRVVED